MFFEPYTELPPEAYRAAERDKNGKLIKGAPGFVNRHILNNWPREVSIAYLQPFNNPLKQAIAAINACPDLVLLSGSPFAVPPATDKRLFGPSEIRVLTDCLLEYLVEQSARPTPEILILKNLRNKVTKTPEALKPVLLAIAKKSKELWLNKYYKGHNFSEMQLSKKLKIWLCYPDGHEDNSDVFITKSDLFERGGLCPLVQDALIQGLRAYSANNPTATVPDKVQFVRDYKF